MHSDIDRTPRLLLVEDEWVIANVMARTLESFGYAVVGPAPSVKKAMSLIMEEPISAAVLDINLGGELVYPVARELQHRKIPFMFLSGYGSSEVPTEFAGCKMLCKPVGFEVLRAELQELLGTV